MVILCHTMSYSFFLSRILALNWFPLDITQSSQAKTSRVSHPFEVLQPRPEQILRRFAVAHSRDQGLGHRGR